VVSYARISQKEAQRMRRRITELEACVDDSDLVREVHRLSTFGSIGERITREVKTAILCGFRVEITADVTGDSITLNAVRRGPRI